MSSFTTRLEVTPLDDGRKWKVIRTFRYHVGSRDSGAVITIPAGFITDFASSPRIFWSIVSPWGKYGKAAIVHDLLYHIHGFIEDRPNGFTRWPVTRKEADDIFLEAMEVLGVKPWRRKLMYLAVRAFGWLAWNRG